VRALNDGSTPDLDDSQRRVAEADAEARLVVIAGAGQGKTEVVAARLQHLMSEEGLSGSTAILVLSFSRAAVHAIRTRMLDRDLAEVNVRTFDSFAAEILLELSDNEPSGSFTERIREATRLIHEAKETPDGIVDLEHVIIDEVQDLVGDRAEFVLAILDRLDDEAGLTVLGDPLQGVYDFVLKESTSKLAFDDFYSQLSTKYGTERVSLDTNYRAQGYDCRRIVALADDLRALDAESALAKLTEFENSLEHLDNIQEWDFVELYSGRSAILCRSNAEVLRVSRALMEQGIVHSVRRQAQSFGAARWIASALSDTRGPIVPQTYIEAAVASMAGDIDAVDAWNQLKVAEGPSRNSGQINLDRIRKRVRSTAVPLQLTQVDGADLIVSTVHRAKGLEFDNVFIVDGGYTPAHEDSLAKLRRKYVALSRARDNIAIVKPKWGGTTIVDYRWMPGRLQERCGRAGRSRAVALEIDGDDVYTSRPTSAGGSDATAIQDALRRASLGTPVEAELDRKRAEFESPIYTLTCDDKPIGRTTEEFGRDFAKTFNLRDGKWPVELGGVLLVSVETTAGDPAFTEQEGIGVGGFWLVPRVAGLAKPSWDVMEK